MYYITLLNLFLAAFIICNSYFIFSIREFHHHELMLTGSIKDICNNSFMTSKQATTKKFLFSHKDCAIFKLIASKDFFSLSRLII